jgi:hypothetical protein
VWVEAVRNAVQNATNAAILSDEKQIRCNYRLSPAPILMPATYSRCLHGLGGCESGPGWPGDSQ